MVFAENCVLKVYVLAVWQKAISQPKKCAEAA